MIRTSRFMAWEGRARGSVPQVGAYVLHPAAAVGVSSRLAAVFLEWVERVGYLRSADPLSIKLRWVARLSLA